MSAKAYYTKEEVMKMLNKPSATFQREVNAGIIPSEIEEGRQRGRKFPKEAIDAYVQLVKKGDQRNFKFEPSTNADLWKRVQNSLRVYGAEDIVSYKRVLEWKEINPDIYMSLKDGDKLVGAVTIMPLAESTIQSLIRGKIREQQIPDWAIKKWNESALSAYIPTVTIVASGDKVIDGIRKRSLIRYTLRWAITLDKQYDIKNWYGIAATPEGERLMRDLGFKPVSPNYKGYILESIEKSSKFLQDFIKKVEAEDEDIPMQG